ncbi:metallophosphoesterase [Marinitoga lauensis]|uniref:metallophosphoesterase n=1 Tax=Marinitoga lauensis TaxID=2201189 RepID=UPI0010131B8F
MLLIVLIGIVSLIKVSYPFILNTEENLIFKNSTLAKNAIKSDSYTFVVLGDNKNSISTFNKIIKQINNDNSIKFVINTGDMVFDGNPIKYDFFLKQIKKLNKPCYL